MCKTSMTSYDVERMHAMNQLCAMGWKELAHEIKNLKTVHAAGISDAFRNHKIGGLDLASALHSYEAMGRLFVRLELTRIAEAEFRGIMFAAKQSNAWPWYRKEGKAGPAAQEEEEEPEPVAVETGDQDQDQATVRTIRSVKHTPEGLVVSFRQERTTEHGEGEDETVHRCDSTDTVDSADTIESADTIHSADFMVNSDGEIVMQQRQADLPSFVLTESESETEDQEQDQDQTQVQDEEQTKDQDDGTCLLAQPPKGFALALLVDDEPENQGVLFPRRRWMPMRTSIESD